MCDRMGRYRTDVKPSVVLVTLPASDVLDVAARISDAMEPAGYR
jgi:hypothetical protein